MLVVPAGNAPASSGYQPGALLLSYETMAEGVGNAPTSARADPVFKTGAASLYLPAFQKWSGWQELHLRPPRSEQGRLLLTLHPEKWLPDLDSHQDKRLSPAVAGPLSHSLAMTDPNSTLPQTTGRPAD